MSEQGEEAMPPQEVVDAANAADAKVAKCMYGAMVAHAAERKFDGHVRDGHDLVAMAAGDALVAALQQYAAMMVVSNPARDSLPELKKLLTGAVLSVCEAAFAEECLKYIVEQVDQQVRQAIGN